MCLLFWYMPILRLATHIPNSHCVSYTCVCVCVCVCVRVCVCGEDVFKKKRKNNNKTHDEHAKNKEIQWSNWVTDSVALCQFEWWQTWHWESTASMVQHRELYDNCSALGIRLNRITFSSYTFSQFPNPALDHLHASSCFSPLQRSFILNILNQKI